MHAIEMVAVLGVAAMLATTGYRAANERRDAARLKADLDAVAALALAYQQRGPDCGRPPGVSIEVEDILDALGGERSGPAEPGAWSVRYHTRLAPARAWPVGSPRSVGFAFDVVRAADAPVAEAAALASMGGRSESGRMVMTLRWDGSGTPRGRRVFAAWRGMPGC